MDDRLIKARWDEIEVRVATHYNMRRATYCGPRQDLLGATAIIMDSDGAPSEVLAQFDDLVRFGGADGGLAHGWHPFPKDHFFCG